MENIHVGTMGWSYDFWVENFYLKGSKSDTYLTEYSEHFDTVEVDNTFYRIPSKSSLERWKEQTPDGFIFSAKFPQIITHRKMLKDCEKELELFIERVSTLQEKLGPLLLQFPHTFGPEKVTILENFLPELPKKYRYAVEVRNRKLLDDTLYSVLKRNGIALAFVVGPFVPETNQITADFVYIRWEGDRSRVNGTLGRVEVDKTDEIRSWADKINKLSDTTEEVFGYFSKHYSGHPPSDARTLLKWLKVTP